MDQGEVFRLRVADDDIVRRHQEHVEDFPFCGEAFAAARRAKDQTVRGFELLSVGQDHIAGSGVQAVVQCLAALEKLLGDEGHKDRHGGSGKAPLYPDLVDAQRERRHKALLLLEVQAGELAVIFLRHTGSPEHVVIQLLLRIRDIHHKEGQKEHPFIPALQVTEDVLCLARVGRQVGRDDIHIEPLTGGALLGVDLHTVQVRDLALDRLDRLILVHAADMQAH